MDLFAALLVTHTFRMEFERDRARALSMIEEKPESTPAAAPQPVPMHPALLPSTLGVLTQRLLKAARGVLHVPATLPRPH